MFFCEIAYCALDPTFPGTPLQNNLHEMWALLNFLLPEVFGSANAFDEWFNLDTDDSKAKEKLIVQLQRLLRPFMLRRLKIDVAKQLLPKQRTHLYVGTTPVLFPWVVVFTFAFDIH